MQMVWAIKGMDRCRVVLVVMGVIKMLVPIGAIRHLPEAITLAVMGSHTADIHLDRQHDVSPWFSALLLRTQSSPSLTLIVQILSGFSVWIMLMAASSGLGLVASFSSSRYLYHYLVTEMPQRDWALLRIKFLLR